MDDAQRGANAIVSVDLEKQEIRGPDGGCIKFEVDAFRKHCLLNGLDDIGLTLEKRRHIDSFEDKQTAWPSPGCGERGHFRACRKLHRRNEGRNMAANKKLLILPGDGIGPEVMTPGAAGHRLVRQAPAASPSTSARAWSAAPRSTQQATPLTDATMEQAMQADAVLFGAVGGPKWDNLPFAMKPERGLLRLRKEMELFANLRPALVFDALADASTLKPELVRGLDIMIVRELTGGVYFGEPRGIETLPDGERRGVDTQVYTDQRDRPRRAASPSNSRASASKRSPRSRRPTSWKPACSGARK